MSNLLTSSCVVDYRAMFGTGHLSNQRWQVRLLDLVNVGDKKSSGLVTNLLRRDVGRKEKGLMVEVV